MSRFGFPARMRSRRKRRRRRGVGREILTKKPPWLQIAEDEARRWKGQLESEISKSMNYHQEVGVNIPNLIGNDHPWCASFVNYCLQKTGFKISHPPALARSFLNDPNFLLLDQPIFGAIAVVGNHHVAFIYAYESATRLPILLGGNQSDQINFKRFSGGITYHIPVDYHYHEETLTALKTTSAAKLNTAFGIRLNIKGSNSTR